MVKATEEVGCFAIFTVDSSKFLAGELASATRPINDF